MRGYFLFVILFALGINSYSNFLWGQSVEIRVDQANARNDHDSSATIVAVLERGGVYSVINDMPYWYELQVNNNLTAWVAKSLCKLLIEERETGEEPPVTDTQPLNELYPLPTFATSVSVPDCTASTLIVDWSICGAGGSTRTGGQSRNWRTNQQKNRLSVPCNYAPVTVAQMLDLRSLPADVRTLPAADPRANYLISLENQAVMVEGFLAMVKQADEETTNCYSNTRKDLHVELISTNQGNPAQMRNRVVINEVSPWFREANSTWTVNNLGQYASYTNGYGGSILRPPTPIRVYGWLFYDDPHSGNNVASWRGTAWELHPITRIEVLINGSWTRVQ